VLLRIGWCSRSEEGEGKTAVLVSITHSKRASPNLNIQWFVTRIPGTPSGIQSSFVYLESSRPLIRLLGRQFPLQIYLLLMTFRIGRYGISSILTLSGEISRAPVMLVKIPSCMSFCVQPSSSQLFPPNNSGLTPPPRRRGLSDE
jgi:hypothetical protein